MNEVVKNNSSSVLLYNSFVVNVDHSTPSWLETEVEKSSEHFSTIRTTLSNSIQILENDPGPEDVQKVIGLLSGLKKSLW